MAQTLQHAVCIARSILERAQCIVYERRSAGDGRTIHINKDPVKCRVNSALRHRQMCARAHYSCTYVKAYRRQMKAVGTQTEKGKICTHAHMVYTERAPRTERQI